MWLVFCFAARVCFQHKMLAAIGAVDKALYVDGQKDAGVRDVRVAGAGDLGRVDEEGFEGLRHGGILSDLLGKARGSLVS